MTDRTINRLIFTRRAAVVALLGFASGMPLALSDSTLQAWLTVANLDVSTIGLFSLVGLPYTIKFLWAPIVDRFDLKFLGRRRDWIFLSQIMLSLTLFFLGSRVIENDSLALVGLLAFLVAFISACVFFKAGLDATIMYYNLGQVMEIEISIPIWWMFLAFPVGFFILALFSLELMFENLFNLLGK